MPKYQPRKKEMSDKTNKDGLITLQYPLLPKTNYTACAIKMKVFMQAQGVWDAVDPKNPQEVVEAWKDKIALTAIYQGIPKDMLLFIAEKETTKDAWETLKTMYLGADRVRTAKSADTEG